MISPKPTAPTNVSRASEARRSRSSMLPGAKLRSSSERETACPIVESTSTTIDPGSPAHKGGF